MDVSSFFKIFSFFKLFLLSFKIAKFCFRKIHIPPHEATNVYLESLGESKSENAPKHFLGEFGLVQAWKEVGEGSQCLPRASESGLSQVCQTPPASAGAAVHRAEVPGAPLLLQADWRHPH